MKGGRFFRLLPSELIPLPFGSELFMLPDRVPAGYDPRSGRFISISSACRGRRFFPAAAFISPGFTVTYQSAFQEKTRPVLLPLFSYSAVVSYKGRYHVAAVRVDTERRHDLRLLDMNRVRQGIARFRKLFSGNRVIRHLETCALAYGCPTAKCFFLTRSEAPLPTAPACNARCFGCISYQPGGRCSASQARIRFIPSWEEITEIALYHLGGARDPIVSFGQGCEGEPLLAGHLLERSIRSIRAKTGRGLINLNTNGSQPGTISRLFDAGLDSIRVSFNSAQEKFYSRYYRPRRYSFKDAVDSLRIARKKKGFVSINYLTMPGFTDSQDEYDAFVRLLETHCIDMIQWRNLNYDPLQYFRDLKFPARETSLLGVREVIRRVRKRFPALMMGYYNPSRKRIERWKNRLR